MARAYADTSPFNTQIEGRRRTPNSDAVIQRLVNGSGERVGPSYFVAGEATRDWGVAVYEPGPKDPEYTIVAKEWGSAEIDGNKVRLPAGAKPSGVWPLRTPQDDWDSHLTIIQDGVEYDLWNVRSIGNGQIVCRWGGKTDIKGDGLGSGAVAANFGSLAGLIRAEEFAAGQIDHALSLTVPCTVGYKWPADKGGWECGTGGESKANALVMGDLIQLTLSNDKIALFPFWKRAILKAWKKYGAYVRDTTASRDWALWFESGQSYTSLGKADPFVEVAHTLGMPAYDYDGDRDDGYWFNIEGGVDWARELRVVA